MGFYSTPFIVLTDTFSGKFLYGGDVGRGHVFCNQISQLTPVLTSIRGTDISPHMGIDIVLYDTISGCVHHTQIDLGMSNGVEH